MNVLLTSVGRRSYLVNYFKKALDGKGQVVGSNMFGQAAGLAAADIAVVSPPANHPDYIPFLKAVCKEYDIGLLCSLHDLDVYILSQNQQWLADAGIAHTLPSAEWGRIALDKYECTLLLDKHGIPVPKTTICLDAALRSLRLGEVSFPLVIKARAGFGSLGLAKANNETELISAYKSAASLARASGSNQYLSLPDHEMVLIQQAITGREVCIGILNDFSGTYRAHFTCEVHSMRSGESDWATSISGEPHLDMARKLSNLTRHKGVWGIDFLEDGQTFRAIDVNPRFTGDYPFHHLAGADIPRALVYWAAGKEAPAECYTSIVGVTGFKDLVPKTISCERVNQ